MKFAIALFAPPHSPAARRALRFAEAALAGGHEIVRLFFYQDGVHSASANVVAAQDELDVAAEWSRFVQFVLCRHDVRRSAVHAILIEKQPDDFMPASEHGFGKAQRAAGSG